jgi:DNA-binding transcriptional LysR family regulator
VRGGKLQDSTLVARKIAPSELNLLAAPSYLRRRGTPKKLRDLASHDCLLYRPEAGKNIWRLTGPSGDESVEVTGPIGADDIPFLYRAALAGAGIALLPPTTRTRLVSRGELVRVLPDYALRGSGLYLVSPHARHQVARVRLLMDYLVTELTKAFIALQREWSTARK